RDAEGEADQRVDERLAAGVMEVEREALGLDLTEKQLTDLPRLQRGPDADRVSQGDLVAAEPEQLPRDVESRVGIDGAFVGTAPDGGDVGAHAHARVDRRRDDLTEGLQGALDALVSVLAVVGPARRHEDGDLAEPDAPG